MVLHVLYETVFQYYEPRTTISLDIFITMRVLQVPGLE